MATSRSTSKLIFLGVVFEFVSEFKNIFMLFILQPTTKFQPHENSIPQKFAKKYFIPWKNVNSKIFKEIFVNWNIIPGNNII